MIPVITHAFPLKHMSISDHLKQRPDPLNEHSRSAERTSLVLMKNTLLFESELEQKKRMLKGKDCQRFRDQRIQLSQLYNER